MRRIAGAIITFSRPDYYERALNSIENNKSAYDLDWYVFQDGFDFHPKDAHSYKELSKEDILSNIKITNSSKLPIKHFDVNKFNFGVNYQINKIFKLFDEGYDTLFIFEDDLIVSQYYIDLLRNCSDEYRDIVASFHSVGYNGHNRKLLARAKAPRLWGFYLTKEVWNSIKKDWYSFYNESTPRLNREPFYDTVITQSVRKNTKGKFESIVSRAINIGINGHLAYRPENWKRRKMHLQSEIIDFEDDKDLKGFTLNK